ncbi:MAG: hypothetical protein ACK58T_43840, partial [Phycisphaerae bacterium]
MNLAIKYLRNAAGTAELSFDMMWLRVVGRPGGVMIRWAITSNTTDALLECGALRQEIQKIDGEPGMFVSNGGASRPRQFDGVSDHLLVFRTDIPRHDGHVSNKRSLMHFLAILAGEDIDIAQYESVEGSDNRVEHAMRLFDYRGRGKTWLVDTVDRANRLSAVLGGSVIKDQIPALTSSLHSINEASATHGDLHPITIKYGSREDESTFQEFIAHCLTPHDADPALAGMGYITFSIHGPDVPGFLIACLQRVQT